MHFFSEKERAEYLRRQFTHQGLSAEDFLRPGFDMIAIHANSTLFAVNAALADFLGYCEEEMIGLNAWMLFDPQSITVVKQKLAEKSEDLYHAVSRRKDGSLARVELWGENIEVGGEPARAVSVRVLDADYRPEEN
jgi:PAS domain S-box-containing protein